MSHPACQCIRWPEKCWASHVGTRGLCAVCMPGNCERPRPVTSEGADVTHRSPRAGRPDHSATLPAWRAALPPQSQS